MSTNIIRVPDRGKTATTVSLNSSTTVATYYLERMRGYTIGIKVSDAAALSGTFKLQASNNAWVDNTDLSAFSGAVWVDVDASSQTVTADGDYMWTYYYAPYDAVRLVWTNSAGTGNVKAYFLAKD